MTQLTACLLLFFVYLFLSGCAFTQNVKKMSVKRVLHYEVKEAYLSPASQLVVRLKTIEEPLANDYYIPYNLLERNYYTYGTQNKINFYTFDNYSVVIKNGHVDRSQSKSSIQTITSESKTKPLPDFSYPQCDLQVSVFGVELAQSHPVTGMTDFGRPFTFGEGTRQCDGLALLAIRNRGASGYVTEFYVKVEGENAYHRYGLDHSQIVYGQVQPHRVMLRYILMPIAFIGDIVTFPLQALMLPYMIGGPGR